MTASAWDRVARIVRFLQHIFSLSTETTVTDVIYLLKYEGRGTDVEMMLKDANAGKPHVAKHVR